MWSAIRFFDFEFFGINSEEAEKLHRCLTNKWKRPAQENCVPADTRIGGEKWT
jgi:hypothetical protein